VLLVVATFSLREMAATSTSAVPSLDALTLLLEKVVQRYESALKAKSINFYPSQLTIAPQDIAGPSKSSSVPWTIRCVPALLEKAKEKPAQPTEHTPQSKDKDVFAPPYHPDLLVEELPEHTVLVSQNLVEMRKDTDGSDVACRFLLHSSTNTA
jgi:hypothetical protein